MKNKVFNCLLAILLLCIMTHCSNGATEKSPKEESLSADQTAPQTNETAPTHSQDDTKTPEAVPPANSQDDTKAPAETPTDPTQDKENEGTDTATENPQSDTATAQDNNDAQARLVDITVYYVKWEDRMCIDPAPGAYEKMDASTKAMFGCHTKKYEYFEYCEPTDTQCKNNISKSNRRAKIEDMGTFKYRMTQFVTAVNSYTPGKKHEKQNMLHFQMEIEKACQMEDSANCYCKITQLTDLVYPFNEAANNRLNADPKAKDAITKKWINNRVDCETAESAASQGITLEGVPLEEIPKVTHGG